MIVHRIGGTELRLDVVPGDGGRIVSMIDAMGREWLVPPAPRNPAAGFVDSPPGGWDECAPTIDSCRWSGLTLPDHGDLWCRPWQVVSATPHGLAMAVRSPLGFRFRRTITVRGRRATLDYVAVSSRRLPFLWAAHPLFRAPTGTRVVLPASIDGVVDVLGGATRRAVSAAALTIDTVPPQGCRKLYVDPSLPVSMAELAHADGARLAVTWSAAAPYLGLWFDNGCHSVEPAIALEPTTGFADSATSAAAVGRVPYLAPGSAFRWQVRLEIAT